MDSQLHIAFACDRAYLSGAFGLVKSILLTARNPASICFHFLDMSQTGESYELLRKTALSHSASLHRHPVNESSLNGICVSRHLSIAAYARLLIPDILDSSIPYVLYFDVDVIVRAPVEDLFEACDKERAVSACTDMCIPTLGSPKGIAYWQEMGLDQTRKYLNSGVLGMNLQCWRRDGLAARMLSHAQQYAGRMTFNDQEALNAVLAGDWHDLGYEWNQQAVFDDHARLSTQPRYAEICMANTRAKVFHYTYQLKPWDVRCKDSRRDEYLKVLRLANAEHLVYRPRLNRLVGDRLAAGLRTVRMKFKLYRKL